MSQRLLILITIALILGLGVFWFTQHKAVAPTTLPTSSQESTQTSQLTQEPNQPIDTSDWKTYKNKEYGFEVKYPNNFRLNTEPRNNGFIVGFMQYNQEALNIRGENDPQYETPISIYSWGDINNPNLKGGNWEGERQYKDFNDFLSDSEHTYINKVSETTIAGEKAYILSMPGEIGYEAIMFERNKRFYQIAFGWTQKTLDRAIHDAFIASLKFVK